MTWRDLLNKKLCSRIRPAVMRFPHQPEPVAERSSLFTQEGSHFDTRLLLIKAHDLLLTRIGTEGQSPYRKRCERADCRFGGVVHPSGRLVPVVEGENRFPVRYDFDG